MIFPQMSHKKQRTATPRGQSRALPRSPRPAPLHFAVTSEEDTSMPCPGGALAKTDPRSSRLQNTTLPHDSSAACIIRF